MNSCGRGAAPCKRNRARQKQDLASQFKGTPGRLSATNFRLSEIYGICGVSRSHMSGTSRSSRTLRAGCDRRNRSRDERCRYGRRRVWCRPPDAEAKPVRNFAVATGAIESRLPANLSDVPPEARVVATALNVLCRNAIQGEARGSVTGATCLSS